MGGQTNWDLICLPPPPSSAMSPLRIFSRFEAPVEPVTNDEDDEEEIIAEHCDGGGGSEIDAIIGAIEDIVVGDTFQELQLGLLEQYHHHFEDTEENKLVYTEVFQMYTTEIEEFITTELSQRFHDFCMERFLRQLSERRDLLDGDIFELLYSLSDFLIFKEMFVDFSLMKRQEGIQGADLSDILSVSSVSGR